MRDHLPGPLSGPRVARGRRAGCAGTASGSQGAGVPGSHHPLRLGRGGVLSMCVPGGHRRGSGGGACHPALPRRRRSADAGTRLPGDESVADSLRRVLAMRGLAVQRAIAWDLAVPVVQRPRGEVLTSRIGLQTRRRPVESGLTDSLTVWSRSGIGRMPGAPSGSGPDGAPSQASAPTPRLNPHRRSSRRTSRVGDRGVS